MSFTLRPFASAALLLSMAGLCAGTLLAAEQTEPSEASAVRARPLVLGVVETAEPSFDDNTVRPVLKAMQSAAPGTQIDVVRLSSATFEVAVAQLKPDLVISPAADFLRIVDSIGAHPIGTRKTKYAKHPSKSAGGAVIALASRTDIQKLTDLRGKYIAATLPTSVDGMLAVRMELAERGFDNRQFFRSVRYLGYSMPNVIESVLSGHFDAGVVPVCTLERIEAEDLIERGALRVISPKSDDDTVCAHTSELYPDLVAATFSWTDPELTRLTTSALLASKSADAEFNWYGTSDFHRIRALEETLARQSGAAFKWLAEHGVNWMKTPYRAVGSPGAWSYSTGSAQAGYDYVQCLNRAYHRLGGRILYRTSASSLLFAAAESMDGHARSAVAGIFAERPEGPMLLIRTPAVIIAAGGFTANRAMIAAFRPDIDPQTPTTANPRGELLDGSTGDGILMAQAAGAKLVDMSAVEVVPFTGGRLTDFVGGDVWLNAEGRRFVSGTPG